jgi:hypothetical protein
VSAPRRVFRPIALQRHEVAASRTVVPHYGAPRIALWLGVLLVLLATGGAVAATARVPVIVEGWAVVETDAATDAHAVVLLAPNEAGRLRAGQPVTLAFPGTRRMERSVTSVVPGLIDPAEARRRWASAHVEAVVGTSPVVAALVPLDAASMANAGSIGRAEVEVGSQSVGSLIPFVGGLFGG